MTSPLYEHPEYPIGSRYELIDLSDSFSVVEHGFLSLRIKYQKSNETIWIGANEIRYWVKSCQISKLS